MSTKFSELLERIRREGGLHLLEVPDDWMQGRSVFGGLQVALALRAMRALVPDAPLRTLQTTFVAPVGAGLVGATAKVLRTGKSATHVEARLIDAGGDTLALVVGVFGSPRASEVSVAPRQPSVVVDAPLEVDFEPKMFPTFTQHFAVRWLRGTPPFFGNASQQHVLELGMRDVGATTEAHVVAIADFIPPIALAHLTGPAFGSTLTWMVEMLIGRVDHLPLTGWRVDADLIAARDGYTSQSVMLWGPGGVPVALSRQSMLVFG